MRKKKNSRQHFDPALALGAAVLAQAVRDVKAGSKSARRWLASKEADLFIDAVGDHVGFGRYDVDRWLAA